MAAESQRPEGKHPSTPPSDTERTLFLTSFSSYLWLLGSFHLRDDQGRDSPPSSPPLPPSQQPQSPAPTSHHPPQINRDDQGRSIPYPSHLHCQPPRNTPSSLHLSLPILGSSHPINTPGAAVWEHGISEYTEARQVVQRKCRKLFIKRNN